MRILTTDTKMHQKILDALRKKVGKKLISDLTKDYQEFISQTKLIINQKIRSSDTYKSLRDGILKRDFGIDDSTFNIFDKNIDRLYNASFVINETPERKNSILSLNFNISEFDEGDSRIESVITQVSYVSPRSGENIEWLRWLLYRGRSIINKSWKVYPKDNNGRSRMGIMITAYNKTFTFSVSSTYSGKYGTNFVSEAIQDSIDEIKKILPVSKNE